MAKFNVPNMSCGHCATAIENAVTTADASATLRFDLESRTVAIASDLDDATLAGILENEGYPSELAG